MDADGIGTLVWRGGEILAAILIAVMLLRLATAGFTLVAPQDAGAVPVLHVAAIVAGVGAGGALLLAMPHAEAFRLSRLFAADSPWAIGLGEFITGFALPGTDALAGALVAMRDADGAGAAIGWLAALVLAGGAFIALRGWRGMARLRALVAFLLLMAVSALLLHYTVHLLAWLAARLGFWVFLLLLLLFQRWRHAPPATGSGGH